MMLLDGFVELIFLAVKLLTYGLAREAVNCAMAANLMVVRSQFNGADWLWVRWLLSGC